MKARASMLPPCPGTRPPTATQAHDQLVQALREQQNWEKRAKDAKELLNRMLKSRKETADLAQQHDIKCGPPHFCAICGRVSHPSEPGCQ